MKTPALYKNIKMMRKIKSLLMTGLLVGSVGSLTFCNKKLVDESYATIGKKSINGIDQFYDILRKKSSHINESSYVNEQILKNADMIVHFENERPPSNEDYIQILSTFSDAVFDVSDSVPMDRAIKPEQSKTRVLLYFTHDTDASLYFWRRIYASLPPESQESFFVQTMIIAKQESRLHHHTTRPTFFGILQSHYEKEFQQNIFSPIQSLQPSLENMFYEVRQVPQDISDLPNDVTSQTLLWDSNGDDLIQEFHIRNLTLIVVYNSQPYLNYFMAKRSHREFAGELIEYASKRTANPKNVNIVLLKSFQMQDSQNKQEDEFRFFRVFPFNFLFAQLFIIALLYLLSQWAHKKRPQGIKPIGNREFFEHIKATGDSLRHAKEKVQALEPLVHYRTKKNRLFSSVNLSESNSKQTSLLNTMGLLWQKKDSVKVKHKKGKQI